MKILSVDCSAGPASAAIIEDGRISASSFVNVKLTHSETLLPMIKNTLDCSLTSLENIDCMAVSVGPGSFTGIRIGISAIKGLAAPKNIPCVAVSTLRAMAESFKDINSIICAVMDARCNQVYNAMFEINDGKITRLCDDRALMCEDLANEINSLYKDKNIIVAGDGADLFYPYVEEAANIKKASENLKLQNAVGVGMAAIEEINNGNTVEPAGLLPFYLRLPQAERELKKKQSCKEINL